MTTLTRREAAAGGPPPALDPVRSAGSGGWRGSWRVALRMARRDVRRHRGRSLVVLLMVGLPTALLVFGLTLYATSTITGAERIPYELGSAQARLTGPSDTRLQQDPANSGSQVGGTTPAREVPGFSAKASVASRAQALGRFLDATVVPDATTYGQVTLGDRRPDLTLLALDGRAGLGERLRLVSGRWPTSQEEVTVTEGGLRRGLPSSGPLTLSIGDTDRVVTVVGVSAVAAVGPDVVGLTTFDQTAPDWLVLRSDPVTYAQVRDLNDYGFTVTSADVLRHPPAASEIPADVRSLQQPTSREDRLLLAAGGTILLLVTTLLVGPAFAVGAARQRRTLALAASNGAEVRQLRRTVLAQALVLGVLSALVGAALGVAAVPAVDALVGRLDPRYQLGPFDVPGLQVSAIVAIAVVSSVVAALLPARRLGRLDIVGVMRGQSVSPRPSRLLPVVGLAVAAVGGWQMFTAVTSGGSEIPVIAGGVALIGGSLLVVPIILVGLGRLAAPLGLTLRMATRDAARQRARSAPAVGAVLGAVAAFTMMGVGLTSDTTQSQLEYQPNNLRGEATVNADARDLAAAADVIRQTAPGLGVATLSAVAGYDPGSEGSQRFVAALPRGCTVAQAAGVADTADTAGTPADGGDTATGEASEDAMQTCQRLGSQSVLQHGQIAALPLAEITRRLELTEAQSAAVGRGAIVVLAGALPPGDRATFVAGTVEQDTDGNPTAVRETSRATLPVVTVPLTERTVLGLVTQYGAVVTPQTAASHHWATTPDRLLVHAPDGAIASDTADRLNGALAGRGELHVEDGFHRYDRIVMAILVGVFALLLLVITLTTTALTLAEQQSDQSTLAAVGATRATRRAMAAAQSFVVAGVGALLGLAVGLVPGIAIAHPLTDQSEICPIVAWTCDSSTTHGAIVDIPWLWLGAAVVGIPLLAAGVSWLAVRKAPLVTRRAT